MSKLSDGNIIRSKFTGRIRIYGIILLTALICGFVSFILTKGSRIWTKYPNISTNFFPDQKGQCLCEIIYLQKGTPFNFYIETYFSDKGKYVSSYVHKLTEDFGRSPSDNYENYRASIPVLVNVTRLDCLDDCTVVNSFIKKETLYGSSGNHFINLIYSVYLKPGRYKITIETTQENKNLAGLITKFNVSSPGNIK